MSPPVLIGFAGVLVAAVATGMLAGRCVRQMRIGFIVWAAATLGLTIALAAQSMGFASGFGPATFRASSLFALMLAPLWLAWGLVEVAVASESARFGVRLISSALTVVATVILATDPLTAQPFSQAWPLSGTHFQPVAQDTLAVVQAVAVMLAVVTASLAAVRASRGSASRGTASRGSGPSGPLAPPVTAVIPVALAVLMTAGQRWPLPADAVYPLLSMMAAALVWFAAGRVSEPSRRTASRGGRDEGVRDASGQPGDDYWPDERAVGDYVPDGQYVTYGQGRPGPDGRAGSDGWPTPDGWPGPARPRDDFSGGPAGRVVSDGDRGRRPGLSPRPPERPDRYRESGAGGLAADERARTVPAPGPEAAVGQSVLPASAAGSLSASSAGSLAASAAGSLAASAAGSPAGATARPYGRIQIFTLLDDRAADFDRLAEETAEHVRTSEPDTLVYVIHLVPNAPLQRIFYEIYRDRTALDSHESQPYLQRFVAERRAWVLATNVIELRLKYAKVAPLPSPQPAAAAPPVPAPLPPGPLPSGPLPSGPVPVGPVQRPQPVPADVGPRGPQGPPRSRPLPSPRPQRPDQPRYDERYYGRYDQPGYDQPGYDQTRYGQPRADRERYDERRPDQRQVPSGRPYGG